MINHGKIFYVDDNPKSRRLLTSVMKSCGFEVISAGDPIEALSRIRKGRFDLFLLDYQMPHFTGSQLAQKLKRTKPDVPVVLISGLAASPAFRIDFRRCTSRARSNFGRVARHHARPDSIETHSCPYCTAIAGTRTCRMIMALSSALAAATVRRSITNPAADSGCTLLSASITDKRRAREWHPYSSQERALGLA